MGGKRTWYWRLVLMMLSTLAADVPWKARTSLDGTLFEAKSFRLASNLASRSGLKTMSTLVILNWLAVLMFWKRK